VQEIDLPGGGTILSCHPNNGTIYVAGGQELHRLLPVPIEQQLEELMAAESFKSALALAAALPQAADHHIPRIYVHIW